MQQLRLNTNHARPVLLLMHTRRQQAVGRSTYRNQIQYEIHASFVLKLLSRNNSEFSNIMAKLEFGRREFGRAAELETHCFL